MTDITDRLERLYTDNGTNYVQEAAREIRKLRAEVAGLRNQLHLAEVVRASQVEGLNQGAAGWRERTSQLEVEVAGLREALREIAQFDLWEPAGPAASRARTALAARKGEA